MVKYSANLAKDDDCKKNLLLIHLEKIGILGIINNLNSGNKEIGAMINEFSELFKNN